MQLKQAHESIRLLYELIRQRPDIKRMSVSINQKNDSVKNSEKPESYEREVRAAVSQSSQYPRDNPPRASRKPLQQP